MTVPSRANNRGSSSVQHAIVFLDRESVDAKVRKPNFPHSYQEYQSTWSPGEVVERLKDATIAIINKVPMRAETLKQLPKLKLTQVRSQIGQSERHRGTLRALGLGRIGQTAEQDTGNPAIAGMLRKVAHLVKVEDA